jgi:hypothetical protein
MNWFEPIGSDKHYWHRYSRFYRSHFETLGSVSTILEYGVLNGMSIRWLREMYPTAEIFAVDILPPQVEWPTGPRITYLTADQSDRPAIASLLKTVNRTFDLVIEDGSHMPKHQASCLAETFPLIRPGGMYVLEDLQTSHPKHVYYQQTCAPGTPSSLHLLLLIEHLRSTGQALRADHGARLAMSGLFTPKDVHQLANMIADVDIFHRATLPLRCYNCGTDDFDHVALVCQCGKNLDILDADSITAVLRRAVRPGATPGPRSLIRSLLQKTTRF